MIKQTLLAASIAVLLISCNQGSNSNVRSFTRADFKKHIELRNPEKISLEETIDDPTSFYLINDSLVLVNNNPQHCDSMLEIFALKDRKRRLLLATKGQGPDEFLSARALVYNNTDPSFQMIDDGAHKFYTVNLRKTMNSGKLAIQQKFNYSPDIHPYSDPCLIDNGHYLGYQMWYIADSAYNNHVPMLKIYSTNNQEGQKADDLASLMKKYKYFVPDVNGGQIIPLPEKKQIWVADMHSDRIIIYNDSLKVQKIIQGPDHIRLQYEERAGNIPMTFITFKGDKSYMTYSSWAKTAHSVFIVYININGGKYDPSNMPPVEIFQFDLSGNPICEYKADRFLYAISIDSKEKYLYATTRKSSIETPEFIRYKIN
jgi:hypothetical protein